MKYVLRAIALPFFLLFSLVYQIYWFGCAGYLFMVYGGEWVMYTKERNKERISEVYDLVDKQFKNE